MTPDERDTLLTDAIALLMGGVCLGLIGGFC